MIPKRDAEDWLRNIQAPRVVESGHRCRLKNELIREMRKEKTIMNIGIFQTKKATWALGICLALVLVVGAWAGINSFKTFIVDTSEGPVEIMVENTETLPDGSIKTTIEAKGSGSVSAFSTNNPNVTQEQANAAHQEIQKLIAEKKYKLVGKTVADNGITIYNYEFTLSDGRTVGFGSNQPLE